MTYPNTPIPPWTPAMQALWDTAMHITRTQGAYGCEFPEPKTSFRPCAGGSMFHTILFVATASPEDVAAHLTAVRENMEGWKARVAASKGRLLSPRHEKPVDLTGIDLSKMEINI